LKLKIIIIFTLMLCGRAMTLPYIGSAGGPDVADPPAAWLMPLIGDAVIGCFGLIVLFLLIKKTGLLAWTTIISWNVIGIWDALSAYLINSTNPWPEFFMLKMVGTPMFFAASAMHLIIIILMAAPEVLKHFEIKS